MNTKRLFWVAILVLAGALLVAACAPSPPEAPAVQAEQADDGEHEEEATADEAEEHTDDDEHSEETDTHPPDDHMGGMHSDIPEEAAAVPNPIEANDESIAAGGQIYTTSCAVCHGESGEGDGPATAGLEKPPANLNANHVQENSDGAMFYIISHGKPDTPMPAWDNILSEEERWQVVNYLRTFGGDQAEAEGEHDDGDEHAEDSDAEGEHDEDGEHTEDGGN
jgi:mono/diheme cytochrome c family protein